MKISPSFITAILFFCALSTTLFAQSTTIDPCPFDIEIITTSPTCPGGDDGTIVVRNLVDIGAIYLEWLNINPLPSDTESDSLTGLNANTYILEVSNENDCRDTFTIVLEDPLPLLFNVQTDSTSCYANFDGAIEVIPISAKIDLLFYLESSIEPQDSPNFTGLPGGTHILYVETSAGCLYERIVEIGSPPVLHSALNVTQPCSSDGTGAVEALASGGSGSLSYSLNDLDYSDNSRFLNLQPGQYNLYIRDERGCTNIESFEIREYIAPIISIEGYDPNCPGTNDGTLIVIIEALDALDQDYDFSLNGIDYQPDSIFTTIPSGDFNIYIRNQDGCIIIYPVLQQSQWPNITIDIDHVDCPGASDGGLIIIIEALDVDPNYYFSIDGINFTQDTIFTELAAGSYTIYLQDGNGCEQNLEVNIDEPEAPELEVQSTAVQCPGGKDAKLQINTTGGRPPFQFSVDGQNYQSSPNFNQLDGGEQQIYLLDSIGCSITEIINISEPSAFDLEFTIEEEACDQANGSIVSTLSGGTPPYSYQWSTGNTSSEINNLSAANYTLQVIDQRQCLLEQTVEVKNTPAPLLLGVENQSPSCAERADGQLNIEIASDYGPLKYQWSTGANTQKIQQLTSGTYTLTVEDINQCSSVYEFEVKAPQPIQLWPQFGYESDGTVVVLEANGGTAPYQYIWSDGKMGKTQKQLINGAYEVTIKDASNCSQSFPLNIQNKQLPPEVKIQVFPNPVVDWLTIDLALIKEAEVKIMIYDALGRLVDQKKYPLQISEQISVDLSTLALGKYQLQIWQDDQRWDFPILKIAH